MAVIMTMKIAASGTTASGPATVKIMKINSKAKGKSVMTAILADAAKSRTVSN